MMGYHEALNRCLEAVAEGRDLEAVIASLPARHHDRLRADATLADALRSNASSVPPPSGTAEMNALSRLNAELRSARAEREVAASRRGGLFGLPRFALAGVALAALLLGAAFIIAPNRDGGSTVEAAEFEGVVVANDDGSLTVQTLDTLEEVMVPLDAQVVDENGTVLGVGAIQAGEVVFVSGNRERGGPVLAHAVRRRLDGLPGWCDENADRCRQIAQNLEDAQERCRHDPEVCRLLHDRAADVIGRVADVIDLEDLKQRCQDAGGDQCRDITAFCRDHPDACMPASPGPPIDRIDDARNRMQELDGMCSDRDTGACRRIAEICDQHPVLCAETPQPPRAPVTTDDPAPSPTPVASPTATSQDTRPEPTATPGFDQQPASPTDGSGGSDTQSGGSDTGGTSSDGSDTRTDR
jgi:hypothetical protein